MEEPWTRDQNTHAKGASWPEPSLHLSRARHILPGPTCNPQGKWDQCHASRGACGPYRGRLAPSRRRHFCISAAARANYYPGGKPTDTRTRKSTCPGDAAESATGAVMLLDWWVLVIDVLAVLVVLVVLAR